MGWGSCRGGIPRARRRIARSHTNRVVHSLDGVRPHGGDAAIIVLAVGATLHDTRLGGNWIGIAPALWAAPLILAVGALRYRPGIQLWVTGLLVAGLSLVVAVSEASVFVSPPDATAFAANPSASDLLSLPANLVRATAGGQRGKHRVSDRIQIVIRARA